MLLAPGVAEVQSVLPKSPVRGVGFYSESSSRDDSYSGTSHFVVGGDLAPVQRTLILLNQSMCLKGWAIVKRHSWDPALCYNAVGYKDYSFNEWAFTLVCEDAPLAQALLTLTVGEIVRIANEMFLVVNVNGGNLALCDTWEKTRDHIAYQLETQQLGRLEQLSRRLAQERQERRERIAKVMLKIRLQREQSASLQRLEDAKHQAQLEALLRVNDRVRHKNFGEGVVVAVTGEDNDQQVQVQFSDRTIKLVAHIACMKRLK